MAKCNYRHRDGRICNHQIYYNRKDRRWGHINPGRTHWARVSFIDYKIQKLKNFLFRNKNNFIYIFSSILIIVISGIILYILTGTSGW